MEPNERYLTFRKKVEYCGIARNRYLHSFAADPLASILIRKLHLSPLKSGLAGLILVAATYLAGAFFLHGNGITMGPRTWIDALYDFLLIPVTFYYFVWLSGRMPHLFLRLQQNGIDLNNGPEYTDFAERVLKGRVFHRITVVSGFAFALGLGVVHFLQILGGDSWGGAVDRGSNFHYLKIPVIWIPAWYMFFTIITRELIFVREFRRAVRKKLLNLRVDHPDRCGGLRPLSDYLLQFTYYIAVCGFGLSLLVIRSIKFGDFRSGTLVHLGIAAYILGSFLLFLSPFHPIFLLMRKLEADIREKVKEGKWLADRIFPLETLYKHSFATIAPVIVLLLFMYRML